MKAIPFSALVMGLLLCLGVPASAADAVGTLRQADKAIHDAAAASQASINTLDDQNQALLNDYRRRVRETETLRAYNDHVEALVADQQREAVSLQAQIDGIQTTAQGVVPLMYRMIDTLDSFVQIDVPFLAEERAARVQRLHQVMTEANTSTSEKYRLVLEAYQIENEYGNKIGAYEGTLKVGGEARVVDYFYAGRIAFMALSLDQSQGWIWDNDTRGWLPLESGQLRALSEAIAIARNQAAPDLIKLPVKVIPEVAQ